MRVTHSLNSDKKRIRLRRAVRQRDGDDCWLCGGLMLFGKVTSGDYATLDHVVPRAQGGTHDLGNLKLAHQRCNNLRGNAPVAERLVA